MIAWFTRNGVAANLLMMIIVLGGLASLSTMPRQLFPEFQLDVITVQVPYPGSTPSENEESICKPIEEEIQDLVGIKKMTSLAYEGFGAVNVEVERGYDPDELLEEIKSRVDTITHFPEESEEPVVEKQTIKMDILLLSLVGNVDERTLKELAEKWREELLNLSGITQVRVEGVRDYEIAVEISEPAMREYGLRFEDVARAVRENSIDLPAGVIRAPGGEVLLRTKGKSYTGGSFAEIPIITRADGSRVLLGDIAQIRDGFVDAPMRSLQNGRPAVNLTIQATSNQNVLEISEQVHAFADEMRDQLPEEVEIIVWADRAFYLEGRLDMLRNNGIAGLVLVFMVLTLFLRPSLAVWVTLGIPISFLGSFFVLGWTGDFSINIVSLFGFIMVLGIIVDDAIVVGESVFTTFQEDGPGIASAIKGSQRVAMPVTFAVLTSAVAFLPVFFIPGTFGNILAPIPLVVISALLFSLVESKLILPHHLTWCKVGSRERERLNAFQRVQRRISDGLEAFVETRFKPFLEFALRWRYVTLSLFAASFIITLGVIMGNHLRVDLHPQVPSDYIFGNLTMAEGTPFARTDAALQRIMDEKDALVARLEEQGMADPIFQVQSVAGMALQTEGPGGGGNTSQSTNRAFFVVEMQKSENRSISAPEFARMWREAVGPIAGAKELRFNAYAGGGGGPAVDVQFSGDDFDEMSRAADELRSKLETYEGVYDIRDNYSGGKRELQLSIKPSAEVLGLTEADLARQVRQAFYGEEAQRIQRGKHEIRVMVRYPEETRRSIGNLETMRIRMPDGTSVPFDEVAEVEMGRGSSTITRVDRERVINVRADADEDRANMAAIREELKMEFLPALMEKHPGVDWSFQGEAKEQAESFRAMGGGAILVAFAIYALMAIPFRSYTQPLIVMCVIPFGLVGAAVGHLLFGMHMNMLSMLGMLALAGVLVNDSLVLVDFINTRVRSGEPLMVAVRAAGARRFRPILLTSLTTVMGLLPILMEQSLQAQFLIPMAISMAFGLAFGTCITLVLVPSVYMILEDVQRLIARFGRFIGKAVRE